jgi:RNA polymerase sigma factor (sigma-70 family)
VEGTVVTRPGAAATTSFEALFAAEYPRLARALFLLTGSQEESEDLAQEAMARLYEKWDRVSAMESPTGYLYRTGLNLHRKRQRRLGVRRRRDVAPVRASPDPVAASETRSEIRRALSCLSPGLREALILVTWLDLTDAEAGAILGIQPGAVRVRVSRAKAVIRERFGGLDDE